MSRAHLVLQSKGGVGKSLVAALLSQYFQSREDSLICIDTDSENATLASYRALPSRKIPLMEGGVINEKAFDSIMDMIPSNPDDEIVIDNVTSAFVPLMNYLLEKKIFELLENKGYELLTHTVVTGGQAFLNTIDGLGVLITRFPGSARFVVWLNEYFGPIEQDGKAFREMKIYREHEERIRKVITLPKQSELFERDMQQMLKAHATFDETMRLAAFQLLSKSRLFRIKEALFAQMEGL